jgi:hypothetical protein
MIHKYFLELNKDGFLRQDKMFNFPYVDFMLAVDGEAMFNFVQENPDVKDRVLFLIHLKKQENIAVIMVPPTTLNIEFKVRKNA